jgi:hypothetical protein
VDSNPSVASGLDTTPKQQATIGITPIVLDLAVSTKSRFPNGTFAQLIDPANLQAAWDIQKQVREDASFTKGH